MNGLFGTIRLGNVASAPVNRARLARYLELPSMAQIDPITDAEIRKLDKRRDELLSCWQRAIAMPIARVDGGRIELDGDVTPIEASVAYGTQLLDGGADSLIVAAFTVGSRVDEEVKAHLDRGALFEAFILKQWAATMTEQTRAALARRLSAWAEGRSRSLLPYDGPGYNGWPLQALHPLLKALYEVGAPTGARPLRATDHGVLLPTNSMLIVFGVTPRRVAIPRSDERLAQCHRCAMKNCRYRVVQPAGVACSGYSG